MNETTDLCITCLSTGRRLISLEKLKLILVVLNISVINNSNGGICWECYSIIKKFHNFKEKVYIAQNTLLRNIQGQKLKSLSSLSMEIKTEYDHVFCHQSEPSLYRGHEEVNVKIEVELDSISQPDLNIKQEKDESDTAEDTFNYEPEYSDKNVDIEQFKELKRFAIKKLPPVPKVSVRGKPLLETAVKTDSFRGTTVFPIATAVYGKVAAKSNMVPNKKYQLGKGITVPPVDALYNNTKKVNTLYNRTKHVNTKNVTIKDKFTKVTVTKEEILKFREEKKKNNGMSYFNRHHKCETCIVGFNTENDYNSHMKSLHDPSIGPYICETCQVRFPSEKQWTKHEETHYNAYYICDVCKYIAPELSLIKSHCEEHMTEKEKAESKKNEIKIPGLIDTDSSSEDESDRLVCKDCGRRFANPGNLRAHRRRIHKTQREYFICDICKQSFLTKLRLETHILGHDEQLTKKHSYCEECNIQFPSFRAYKSHMKTSVKHVKTPFQCMVCGKSFVSKTYRNKHYNFYHLNKTKFKCEECNKYFICNTTLTYHNQRHHGLERPRKFQCDVCDKRFFTKKTLEDHSRIHSDERPFMCSECGDTFKHKGALYTHRKLKHGRLPKQKRNDSKKSDK